MADKGLDTGETLERLQRMLIRHRWWIAGTAAAVTLLAVVVSYRLPSRYRSEATLVVLKPQVSTRIVDQGEPENVNEEVLALTREVLSRQRLLQIIDEFHLYPYERANWAIEEVIEKMRSDYVLEPSDQVPGRLDFSSFRIQFHADQPELAQAVTRRLTELFVEANSIRHGQEAKTTSNFLTEQLRVAKAKVDAIEARLRDYKSRNLGALPEQAGVNLGVITDLRMQTQNISNNITRLEQLNQTLAQQRLTLQGNVAGTVTKLQAERVALLNRFTAQHPEVLKKDQEIARAQQLVDRIRSGVAGQGGGNPDEASAAQIQGQIDTNQREIARLKSEEAGLNAQVSTYQQRLSLAPIADQQLKELMRDQELANKEYAEILGKQAQSQVSVTIEQRQEGQQFRVVDPATLPSVPYSPRRRRIAAGSLAVGLLLGLVVAFILDRRDTSFSSEAVLKNHFHFPVVVGIPLLHTSEEDNKRSTQRVLEWTAAAALTAVVLAVELFVYQNG